MNLWQRLIGAAEGNQAVRDSIYKELTSIGSTENIDNPQIEARNTLYKTYGVSGLFNADIVPLALAVTTTDLGYWRAKDDIIQLQWDEPLVMAVIDYHKKMLNKRNTESKKEKEDSN